MEFFARPEWRRVRDAYGLGDLKTRGMDNTFMYGAVVGGEVDVITAYTTDGRIDAFDLVLLEDPLGALPPYDAVLLLSPEAADNDTLVRTLSPLLGAISGDQMRRANGLVDLEGETPGRAAEALEMAIGE